MILTHMTCAVRHSRPCNVVTFCHERPTLLAVGLEKGRGESLLIYDVEHSARTMDASAASSTTMADSVSHVEPMPLLSFGSSESVTSAAFLYSSSSSNSTSPLLVAAMAGKWIRAYDLRAPPRTVTTWGTRSGQSMAANPFNEHQMASSGDDGVVKLWDLRRPMDALLSFSEVDAGAVSARTRPTVVARPLVELEWSTTTSGILTTLERDGYGLRIWDLVDGPAAKVDAEAVGESEGQRGHQEESEQSLSDMRMPVVLQDRRSKPLLTPLPY